MTHKETISTLKAEYERICNAYIEEFTAKQGHEFDYWVGNEVGGVASFIEQYYFNMADIAYDLHNSCKKGLIFKWQDYCLEHDCQWSYHQYVLGFRRRHKQVIDKNKPCHVSISIDGKIISRI